MDTLEVTINDIVDEHNLILTKKLHSVYLNFSGQIQDQLQQLQKYVPDLLEIHIESISDERDNKPVNYWSDFVITDKLSDVSFDTEYDSQWKSSFAKHFQIKTEDIEDVYSILSKIEHGFKFTKKSDAHSPHGYIDITKNDIIIKLGIDGEKPINLKTANKLKI